MPQNFFILPCGNQPVISESVHGICKVELSQASCPLPRLRVKTIWLFKGGEPWKSQFPSHPSAPIGLYNFFFSSPAFFFSGQLSLKQQEERVWGDWLHQRHEAETKVFLAANHTEPPWRLLLCRKKLPKFMGSRFPSKRVTTIPPLPLCFPSKTPSSSSFRSSEGKITCSHTHRAIQSFKKIHL